MERCYRILLIAAVGVLPWIEPPACSAQPKDLPPAILKPPAPLPEAALGQPMAPPAAAPKTGPAFDFKAPPPEDGDVQLPISLAAALRLADDRPIMIVATQASVWVAEAQLQRAKLLWVPTLNLGFDYTRHDGFGPDFNRGLNTAARPLSQNVNFFYGGAGITMNVAMADAIFAPLAARQVLNARRLDIQTAKNDAMLQTAEAYFDVHKYRGTYTGALDVVNRGKKLVERIDELSKDLVPKVEVDRAKRLQADLEQHLAMARQDWRVASADLTQVLRLDPRAVVVPLEHDHLQLTLIDPARSLDDLIPIGLTNRPELASQQALVQAALVRIRQEKLRPFTPSILLNGFQTPQELIQFGAQGFGRGNKLNLWSLRDDISPQLMWQADAMGFGNLARVKEQRGEQVRAIVELFRQQDKVAASVTRAQARLQSAAVRVLQAERSLQEAIVTFDGNYEGLRQTTRFGNILVQAYRPQEAVVALESLRNSYDQYFTTVAEYNRTQFQMFHSLGYPAREISYFNPAGDTAAPVNTDRPGFLPPVGTGPPPATR